MKFFNPGGLWLLLGVPFLIILFIIRSRHRDRNVASTFIWKLSNRYMKKRVHLYALSRLILLLLEILAVVAAAMIVAKPAISNLSSVDHILLFDCSASMQVKDSDGYSRLDHAKNEAKKYIDELKDGHRISVIAIGEEAVCPLRYSDSSDRVLLTLEALSAEDGGCDLTAGFELANELSSAVMHPNVVLFTDRACENTGSEYTSVADMSLLGEQINLSAVGLRTYVDVTGKQIFEGKIYSDGYNGKLAVGLRVNGKTVDAMQVECADGETVKAEFVYPAPTFEKAEIYLGVKDGYETDNSYVLCPKYIRQRQIQIVSSSPFFLQKSLQTVPGCTVKTVDNFEDARTSGFDLYIYDGIAPMMLPKDGSVMIFNTESAPLGIAMGKSFTEETLLRRDPDADPALVPSFNDTETVISGYSRLETSAAWKTLLFCADDPVAAYRTQVTGTVVTAFSFDIHDTNMPLQTKFLLLVEDLLEYSAHAMIGVNDSSVGQTLQIYAEKGGYLSMRTPLGEDRALPVKEGKTSYTPVLPGVYTLSEQRGEREEDIVSTDIFVHIPPEEFYCEPISELEPIAASANEEEARDATLDVTIWILAAMLILLMMEWGVYLYEQY